MKKLLMLFVLTAFLGTVGFSQESDAKVKKAEWEKKLRDELKLTAEQAPRYDAITAEYNTKFDELSNDATTSKDIMHERKATLKKEKQAKLFEFLTTEQQAKYQELMDKKKAKKPEGS